MRARDLDLNLLLVFNSLYEERSVSRAARRLGLSQPTVSASLGRLRGIFNDQLFYKTADGMEPTQRASMLRGPIDDVLRTIEQEVMVGAPFDPETTEREFRIALGEISEMTHLPMLWTELKARAPLARLVVTTIEPTRIAKLLEEGMVDVAVGQLPQLARTSFNRQPLFTRRSMKGLAGARNPIPKPLTLETFACMNHAVVGIESGYLEMYRDAFEQAGCRLNVALTVPRIVSLPYLLPNSDLVAIVPAVLADHYARDERLHAFELPVRLPPIQVAQYWHRRLQDDPATVWFRQLISDLLFEYDPVRELESIFELEDISAGISPR